MGKFRYVGEIEDIRGKWFEVPDDVKSAQAKRYIEQLHAEQVEQARLELEQAEQAARRDEAGEGGSKTDELDLLRSELAALHQRLEQPDTSKAAEAISSTARAMQSSWDISRDLQKLEEQARAATAKNQHLADSAETFFRETEQERKKITGVTKANQKIMNEAFTSYANKIKELRKEKTELEYEIGEMKTEIKNNRKDMAKLRKILADWEASQNDA